VLCTTQTLAQGVNFPAQLVIVKGTQYYSQGAGFKEYDELSLLQMLGRCGRPQFTQTGNTRRRYY
jgi:replicative superfamily II helicase